jgi:hypothetical protein
MMRIKPIFAWYDLWVGAFYDRAKRRLYIFPVPMLGFYIERRPAPPVQVGRPAGHCDDDKVWQQFSKDYDGNPLISISDKGRAALSPPPIEGEDANG